MERAVSGESGKVRAAHAVETELTSSVGGLLFGAGPAATVSHSALLTTEGQEDPESPIAQLDLEPSMLQDLGAWKAHRSPTHPFKPLGGLRRLGLARSPHLLRPHRLSVPRCMEAKDTGSRSRRRRSGSVRGPRFREHVGGADRLLAVRGPVRRSCPYRCATQAATRGPPPWEALLELQNHHLKAESVPGKVTVYGHGKRGIRRWFGSRFGERALAPPPPSDLSRVGRRPRADESILHIGCGAAGLAQFEPESRITGVDRLRPPSGWIRSILHTVVTSKRMHGVLPFGDGEFDIAYSSSLIEHLEPRPIGSPLHTR